MIYKAILLSLLFFVSSCNPPPVTEANYLAPQKRVTVKEYQRSNHLVDTNELPAADLSREADRPSYEVLQNNQMRGADRLPNRFFYTEATRAGARKHGSGPCKGYYVGEEWFCQDRDR